MCGSIKKDDPDIDHRTPGIGPLGHGIDNAPLYRRNELPRDATSHHAVVEVKTRTRFCRLDTHHHVRILAVAAGLLGVFVVLLDRSDDGFTTPI